MDVGKLNKQVAIRTNTPAVDAGGGYTDSYATTITVWGSVTPLRGSERERAMAIDSSVTHRIRIRYNSNLTVDDQLTYNSRTFRVHSVIDVDERNHVMEVMASEVT